MILFVSGRCDIPAYYTEWFFQRIKEKYVDVRNPFNPHQISRIPLTKQNIDAILFCTKNPLPMLNRLEEIPFPYVFHVTLTPYHQDIEPNVIDKHVIMNAIQTLSKRIGKDRVIVRYDPILFTERYTVDYHIKAFAHMAKQLHTYIDTIIISFVDAYKNTKANMAQMKMVPMEDHMIEEVSKGIGSIAQQYGLHIQTCAEAYDLTSYGIKQGACVSKELMEQLLQHPFTVPKGKPIRNCGCIPTVDIGDYNACAHLCRYCYANYDEAQVKSRMRLHDPKSSVLLGTITQEDRITIRKEKEVRQEMLF